MTTAPPGGVNAHWILKVKCLQHQARGENASSASLVVIHFTLFSSDSQQQEISATLFLVSSRLALLPYRLAIEDLNDVIVTLTKTSTTPNERADASSGILIDCGRWVHVKQCCERNPAGAQCYWSVRMRTQINPARRRVECGRVRNDSF